MVGCVQASVCNGVAFLPASPDFAGAHSFWRMIVLMGLGAITVLSNALPTSAAQAPAIYRETAISHPEIGYRGMVSSQDVHATDAAVAVLDEGGNAVDAAVTAGLTLAVTLPRAGNIGGGGFMLVHDAKTGSQTSIDYREQAGAAAHADMFLDDNGQPIADLSRVTHLAAGVPGTLRGFELALKKFGSIDMKRALAPAIKLAEEGFPVSEDLFESLQHYRNEFALSPEAMRVFYQPDGSPWPVGHRLVQSDLAKTLRRVAENGVDEFYTGQTARLIVDDMVANGGILTSEDLANYKALERRPLTGSYRGVKVVSMPPPSSGGTHLIQMLNILERFPMEQFGHHSADSIHVMAEAMRLAYADRSRYMGDPDFVDVPVDYLTSRKYAIALAERIDMKSATPSMTVLPGQNMRAPFESHETTHFSVIDADGNAVSNTYTLNFSYGSKLMVPGTGILLNNQMDDFTAKPGAANAYGLIGGRANAIAPGKRMLSSMTPTLLFREDGSIVATGSPGGSRIINVVLQMIVNLIDYDMSVAEATVSPRFHHQWFPDSLGLENGFSPDTIRLLAARGHKIRRQAAIGSTQTVCRFDGVFVGFSDLRRRNSKTLGLPALPVEVNVARVERVAESASAIADHGHPPKVQTPIEKAKAAQASGKPVNSGTLSDSPDESPIRNEGGRLTSEPVE